MGGVDGIVCCKCATLYTIHEIEKQKNFVILFFIILFLSSLIPAPGPALKKFQSAALTCGEPVNETTIDHLEGILDRLKHPPYPEPDVALLFRKNEFDNVQADVIEVNLLDAIQSVSSILFVFYLFNQLLREYYFLLYFCIPFALFWL